MTVGKPPNRADLPPVLVGVSPTDRSGDVVQWAAAQAVVGGRSLLVVHVIGGPDPAWKGFGGPAVDHWDPELGSAGAAVIDRAVADARQVAPHLPISTALVPGPVAAGVLREGRRSALIVLGRGRPSAAATGIAPVVGQVTGRSVCPVAVVGLAGQDASRRSSGRVVVGLDAVDPTRPDFRFAFEAAQSRGIGVTAVHVHPAASGTPDGCVDAPSECRELIATVLRAWARDFPDVEVRLHLTAGDAGRALAVESAGAALLVLGPRSHRGWLRPKAGTTVNRLISSAACPVVIVGTEPQRRAGEHTEPVGRRHRWSP